MFLAAGVVAGAFNDKGSFSAVEVHGAGAQASALPKVAAPSGLKSVITGLVQVIQ